MPHVNKTMPVGIAPQPNITPTPHRLNAAIDNQGRSLSPARGQDG